MSELLDNPVIAFACGIALMFLIALIARSMAPRHAIHCKRCGAWLIEQEDYVNRECLSCRVSREHNARGAKR